METESNGVVETQTLSQTETSGSQESQVDQTSPADLESTNQADEKQTYKPFASGKEKFKVDGREYEWDWETTQRMARHGYAGRRAMQEKAELQKKHETFYNQLVQAANTDVGSLYEILTGKKYNSGSLSSQTQKTSQLDDPSQAQQLEDPRYQEMTQRLARQEQLLQELQQERESRLVEQESKAIDDELNSAAKQFPEIDSKYMRQYVKSQYAAELRAGNHSVTIEDVAFFIAQEMKEAEREKQAKTKQVIAEKKAKASVPAHKPGSDGTKEKEFSGFDDVRKFAGLISN